MEPLHGEQSPLTYLWQQARTRQVRTRPRPEVATEVLLNATVSVPWERPVHAARLQFLRRRAQPGQVSVHVACGTDRLGFIDAAYGLTTILTDIDAAPLSILSQQFAELEARLGPLVGSLRCCQLGAETLSAERGFRPASVHHLTLQNLFNAHLHSASEYPRVIDPLLTILAPGGSVFLTASEASVLLRRAEARQFLLTKMGEIQGYYEENVLMFQVHPRGK